MKLMEALLSEAKARPKALIMAGGAGTGKTHMVNTLKKAGAIPEDITIFNPDQYVEDKKSPAYNNLSMATSMTDKAASDHAYEGQPFVWDTTANNPDKTVNDIRAKGYDVMMIMMITHPAISLLKNFERERNIPKIAVFDTWMRSFELINYYHKLLKDNFVIVPNMMGGTYDAEVRKFNHAAKRGGEGILEYIDSLGELKSSFRKDFEIEDEAALVAYQELVKPLRLDDSDEDMTKNLKKHFMATWEKKGQGPTFDSMKKKVASIERNRDSAEKKYKEVLDRIAKVINSDQYDLVTKGTTDAQVISKTKKFFA
jgi:predicted ABC-type ATPase